MGGATDRTRLNAGAARFRVLVSQARVLELEFRPSLLTVRRGSNPVRYFVRFADT